MLCERGEWHWTLCEAVYMDLCSWSIFVFFLVVCLAVVSSALRAGEFSGGDF